MFECAKSMHRRLHDPLFHQHVFVGDAIDVGCGDDSLAKHAYLFPRLTSVRSWDLGDGDGQELPGVESGSFDVVHSSHSLEHMRDAASALCRWIDVTKVGGFIVAVVPDVWMYEHGHWPSRYNGDHKTAFAVGSAEAELHPRCIPLLRLLDDLPRVHVFKIERLANTFNPKAPWTEDQTANGTAAECGIEFVLQRNA